MKEWMILQRKLHRRVQIELKHSLPAYSPSLRRYALAYKKDFRDMRTVDQHSLFQMLRRVDFAFIGDFHSLAQSQKLLLRLLRNPNVAKPKFLAFEVLGSSDLSLIEKFQKHPNKQNEWKLRNELRLEQVWGSSWKVYRELFLECHNLKIKIIGLKSLHRKLQNRDREAARQLAKLQERTWIFFGEFHCARPHLPRELLSLRLNAQIGVLQQNEDHLLQKHLEEFSRKAPVILKSKKRSDIELYCILHTPVWVKWQSYLDQQIHREESDTPIDALEQVRWSLSTLVEFLEDIRYPHPITKDDLLDFGVIEADDEDFSQALHSLSPKERRGLVRSLEWIRVGCLPRKKRIYMTEKTINACAHAAALYLYQSWTDQTEVYKSFYESILTECVCFFLTKILNHSRKTKHWKELERSKESHVRQALKLREFTKAYGNKKSLIHRSGHSLASSGIIIGRILADRLFEAFLAGEFSKARLNRILISPPKNEDEIFERVVEIQSVGRAFDPSITF